MLRRPPGISLSLGLLCAYSLHPGAVRAESSAADRSVAQSLFDESRDLMAAGRFTEACPKLEESERLDPGGGTMLNLALCHESEGRVATAWSDFKEALGFARRDGRMDREEACKEHIAGLEPKLPRVTFVVPSPAAGQLVQLDGATMGPAVWGRPSPIDPGPHHLSVSAPGKDPWEVRFEIALADKKAIDVPVLADSPQASTAQGKGVAPMDEANHQEAVKKRRMLAYIVGGSGILVAGIGGVFGIRALSKKSDSDKLCPAANDCTPEGKSLMEEANTSAWIANIGVGAGLIGVGVGTYLLIRADRTEQPPGAPPKTAAQRFWIDASTLPGGARAAVGGVF